MSQTISINWIELHQAGINQHPIDYARSLGLTILKSENFGIGDCTFIRVDDLPEELPPHIEISDWEFSDERERRLAQEKVNNLNKIWEQQNKGHIRYKK